MIMIILPKAKRLVAELVTAVDKQGFGKDLVVWYCVGTINYWVSKSLGQVYLVKLITEIFRILSNYYLLRPRCW